MLFDLNSLLSRTYRPDNERPGCGKEGNGSRARHRGNRLSTEENPLGTGTLTDPGQLQSSASRASGNDVSNGRSGYSAIVRSMTVEDIPDVVRLHLQLFDDTFARLGGRFLHQFYRLHLDQIALVALVRGEFAGYHLTSICGRPSLLRLMRLGGWPLVMSALPALPRSAIWRGVRAPGSRAGKRSRAPAFSLYTAVAPGMQGRGVGKSLLTQMVVLAEQRGVPAIEGEHEDSPRLHCLYESVGFHVLHWEKYLDRWQRVPTVMIVEEAARLLTRHDRSPH